MLHCSVHAARSRATAPIGYIRLRPIRSDSQPAIGIALVRAHSIDISTEPPHSPPTPIPCNVRKTVRITAPQTPILA